jgi:hypothetical protein
VIKDGDAFTEKVIACAYKVHSALGPGFNEGIYHNALKIVLEEGWVLKASGHKVGLLINFGNKSCQVRRLTV